MDEGKRRGGALAAVFATAALGVAAVPAYGALNGGDENRAATQNGVPGFVQDDERRDQRPGGQDEDCPWKDGRGGDRGGEGEGEREGGGSPEGVSDSAGLY